MIEPLMIRLSMAALLVLALHDRAGEELRIGIIDLYGMHRVSADHVRAALTFKEGNTIVSAGGPRPAFLATSEERLALLPGIARARAEIVCCDQGRGIVFVGVEETGARTMTFRAAPQGGARLAQDVIQAGTEFELAVTKAVQRGQADEDRSGVPRLPCRGAPEPAARSSTSMC